MKAPHLPRLNQEQLRRILLLKQWTHALRADAELYCNEDDIRLAPALERLNDTLQQLSEIIEDDVVLQQWVTTL